MPVTRRVDGLAFSCKCRYFCPSCHAKRLALWTQWSDGTLLAPVPHREVVLTIPKRLRAYCLYRRRQLGEVDPLACPTCRGTMRIVACITQASVIDQILTHLRRRATTGAPGGARSPPSTRGPSAPGPTHRPEAAHTTP